MARMFMQRKALFAEVGDDNGDAGGGASGGEGQEGSKSKDDTVPKTQFLAALKSAEEKREREITALRTEFEGKLAAATAKPAETPKDFTRTQLNAMVGAGEITQEQADAQMDYQTVKRVESAASRVATETVTATQRKQDVDGQLARYKAVAPEIMDGAHDTRTRIEEEFRELVRLGDPGSGPDVLVTQLKAIRAVLGPVDRLEKSRNGRPGHETHRESGGGGGEGQKQRDPDGPLTYDSLSPREKAHYDKLINAGQLKDKAAVNDELKYAKRTTRLKYGMMAG